MDMITQSHSAFVQVPLTIHIIQDASYSTQSELSTIQVETQRFVESIASRNNPYDLIRMN